MKSHQNTTLNSPTLLMRPIESSDIASIFTGLSHPQVIKHYGVSYKTLEETKAQMKFYEKLITDQAGICFAICSPNDNIFYGTIGLYYWSHQHRKAEIGFWLLPSFWGKGIMNEAIGLTCNYGFEEMKLHRIKSLVESKNTNCIRLMQKTGFVKEGTMKDCEIKNDEFISLEIYARFNPNSI